MSYSLRNSLHALSQDWLGIPGWAWAAFVVACILLTIYLVITKE